MYSFLFRKSFEFQIETTSFCNARCIFCPNSSLKREKNIMRMEVFKTILSKITAEKISVAGFILHINGEPLSDPYIVERVEMCKTLFPNVPVRFTTNLSLYKEDVMRKLLELGLNQVTISLNSLDSDEYYRTMKLDFNKTLENLMDFISLKEKMKSSIIISISLVTDDINSSVINDFRDRFGDLANIRVMKLGQWVGEEKTEGQLNNNSKSKLPCDILYRTINILSNGDFALCCFDAEGIIGKNIMSDGILDSWSTLNFKKIRDHHLIHGRSNKECINCSFD